MYQYLGGHFTLLLPIITRVVELGPLFHSILVFLSFAVFCSYLDYESAHEQGTLNVALFMNLHFNFLT